MTSLGQRPSLEDRIRAATRAAASTVPDDGAPPLQLRAERGRTNRLPGGLRHIRASSPIRPGQRWLPRLAAPLAATAAVIAVIAGSVAVADRTHSSPASGLAGAPPYYLELTSADTTGATATISAASTGLTTMTSPPTTGRLVSPSATAPATTSSPPTTGRLVSPSATAPATTVSPSLTGPTTVRLHMTSMGAVLQRAVIRATVSGARVATISPPRPFDTFVTATAAADDRTFVLAAENIPRNSLDSCGPTGLILARLNPADGQVALTSLHVPGFRANSQVNSIALSPDGTRLAVELEPGRRCVSGAVVPLNSPGDVKNHEVGQEQVSVYSLPGGAVKTWQSPPTWSNDGGQVGQNALSWAADGTLAVNHPDSQDGQPSPGVYLLDTNSAGGSLLEKTPGLHPLLSAETWRQGRWAWSGYGVLTPDGQTVVAPIQRIAPHAGGQGAAFGEFSASTGKMVRIVWPDHVSRPAGLVPYYSVVWTNSSGSVLVVVAPESRGNTTATQSVYGVLHDHRLTPIPGAPRPDALALFGDTAIVF